MFFENEAKTGDSPSRRDGLEPGYLNSAVELEDAFVTYWMNSPITLPLFDNKLSWDIMPGFSVTREFGEGDETVGSFTYATRMAWFPTSPEWSIVGRSTDRRARRRPSPSTGSGGGGNRPARRLRDLLR